MAERHANFPAELPGLIANFLKELGAHQAHPVPGLLRSDVGDAPPVGGGELLVPRLVVRAEHGDLGGVPGHQLTQPLGVLMARFVGGRHQRLHHPQ